MHRLEALTGLSWRRYWDFQYRPPERIGRASYERLRQGYLAHCAAKAADYSARVQIVAGAGAGAGAQVRRVSGKVLEPAE